MLNTSNLKKFHKKISKKLLPGGKELIAIAFLGKTMYSANNSKKSHPKMFKKFKNGQEGACSHAECASLMKIPRQSRHKVTLFVMRFLRNGEVSCAKPCKLCQAWLKDNGISFRQIYYTDYGWDGKWKKLSRDS